MSTRNVLLVSFLKYLLNNYGIKRPIKKKKKNPNRTKIAMQTNSSVSSNTNMNFNECSKYTKMTFLVPISCISTKMAYIANGRRIHVTFVYSIGKYCKSRSYIDESLQYLHLHHILYEHQFHDQLFVNTFNFQ